MALEDPFAALVEGADAAASGDPFAALVEEPKKKKLSPFQRQAKLRLAQAKQQEAEAYAESDLIHQIDPSEAHPLKSLGSAGVGALQSPVRLLAGVVEPFRQGVHAVNEQFPQLLGTPQLEQFLGSAKARLEQDQPIAEGLYPSADRPTGTGAQIADAIAAAPADIAALIPAIMAGEATIGPKVASWLSTLSPALQKLITAGATFGGIGAAEKSAAGGTPLEVVGEGGKQALLGAVMEGGKGFGRVPRAAGVGTMAAAMAPEGERIKSGVTMGALAGLSPAEETKAPGEITPEQKVKNRGNEAAMEAETARKEQARVDKEAERIIFADQKEKANVAAQAEKQQVRLDKEAQQEAEGHAKDVEGLRRNLITHRAMARLDQLNEMIPEGAPITNLDDILVYEAKKQAFEDLQKLGVPPIDQADYVSQVELLAKHRASVANPPKPQFEPPPKPEPPPPPVVDFVRATEMVLASHKFNHLNVNPSERMLIERIALSKGGDSSRNYSPETQRRLAEIASNMNVKPNETPFSQLPFQQAPGGAAPMFLDDLLRRRQAGPELPGMSDPAADAGRIPNIFEPRPEIPMTPGIDPFAEAAARQRLPIQPPGTMPLDAPNPLDMGQGWERTWLNNPVAEAARLAEQGTEWTPEAQRRQDELRASQAAPEVQQQAGGGNQSQGKGGQAGGALPPPPQVPAAQAAGVGGEPPPPPPPPQSGVSRAIEWIHGTLGGFAGKTMPRTTLRARELGEAGARWLSSKIAAKPAADAFVEQVIQPMLGENTVDPVSFGAALTEDNLRSVRDGFRSERDRLASEAAAKKAAGDKAGAREDERASVAEQKKMDAVKSLIGKAGSPFESEEAYQKYLADPEVQQAIERHIASWSEEIDSMYRDAVGLDPTVELPSRGLQTGARINLARITEGEAAPGSVVDTAAVGNLTGTFKKKSPFARKATGASDSYAVDYRDIMNNTFGRQLEIANKNAFDKLAVEKGHAVIASPGLDVKLKDGASTIPFPLRRGGNAQNIYVRQNLAREYRAAANVDASQFPALRSATQALNTVALAGLTDVTVHTSNLATALFTSPVGGKNLALDALLSATGRADIPVALTRAVIKSLKNNKAQIAELSTIGAMRGEHPTSRVPLLKYGGKVIEWADKTTRLVLDDTFKSLVDQGLVENTETNRREFVNQVGQYNRRAQGPLTTVLRDTGMSPFVTAGKTFNALGVRSVLLDPGLKATSMGSAAALRADVLAKWVGSAALVGTANYLITGNLLGRAGVPFGSVDTGKDDENGKPLAIPALTLVGQMRGLRATGIRGAAEAVRNKLPAGTAVDSAMRDIFNTAIGPAAGPPVRFASLAATGFSPAVNIGRTSKVVPPGQNQFAENLKTAAIESNPISKSIAVGMEPGATLMDVLGQSFPRFVPTPGKAPDMMEHYAEIVRRAQAASFIEDVIHRARRMPQSERMEYILKSLDALDPRDREHAKRTIDQRRVMRGS